MNKNFQYIKIRNIFNSNIKHDFFNAFGISYVNCTSQLGIKFNVSLCA